MRIQDSLRAFPLFEHFSEEKLSLLSECGTRVRFPGQVQLVSEGEEGIDTYVIETGEVRIERETAYGRYTLADLGPGEMVGETSFVDRNARSGDATTTQPTQLLLLSPVALSTLMERDRGFAIALYWSFWKSLSQKLRMTNDCLTRFFSETGKPPSTEPPPVTSAGASLHLEMTKKRELFREQKLSSMEINFLASLSKERKYAPGQIIFREGDVGEMMFIVLDGRVMISRYLPGAGEEALSFLERGDYFGEMALIDHEPRSADAKAHDGGAVVLAIPGEVVEGILDINKLSSLRLLTILCSLVAKRLREVDDKIIGWFMLAGGPHS